jgi:hypothetical protein
MRHVLGNLLNDHLSTILTGPEYARVLRGLWYEREQILCRFCEYAPAASDAEVHSRLSKLYARKGDLLALLPTPAASSLTAESGER